MSQPFSQLRAWLAEQHWFLFSWFTTDQNVSLSTENNFAELPPNIKRKLEAAIEDLRPNPSHCQFLKNQCQEAIAEWCDAPQNTQNKLIVLSSPATAAKKLLLEESFDWAKMPTRVLNWSARPKPPGQLPSKLQLSLGRGLSTSQPELVIVPNFSWCFLRSVDGLSGLDYFQEVLFQDPMRFWIVGMDPIGWLYLDALYHWDADFRKVSLLNELSSEELNEWLDPVITQFDISFEEMQKDQQDELSTELAREAYFEQLETLSRKNSVVALQLFLLSLAAKSDEQDALVVQHPVFPDFPSLNTEDDYLLYSTIIHSEITLACLAESLGEDLSSVQYRVQSLRQTGILQQRGNMLSLNPLYYLPLKRRLELNNFLM